MARLLSCLVLACMLLMWSREAQARKEKMFAHISFGYGKAGFVGYKDRLDYAAGAYSKYQQKPFVQAGLEAGYRLNNHFAIASGISWQYYHFTITDTYSYSALEIKEGFISIPLYVQYNSNPDGKLGWIVHAGIRYLRRPYFNADDGSSYSKLPGFSAALKSDYSNAAFAPMINPGVYIRMGPGGLLQIGPDFQCHLNNAFSDSHGHSGHLWEVSAKLSFGFFF